jgi:hypothetical protein
VNGQSRGAVLDGGEGGRCLQLGDRVDAAAGDQQLLAKLEERDHRVFGQIGVDNVGLSLAASVDGSLR